MRMQTNKRLFRTADRQNQSLNKLFYEKEQGSSTSEAEVLPVNCECPTYGSLYGLAYLFWIAMALPFGECEYRG